MTVVLTKVQLQSPPKSAPGAKPLPQSLRRTPFSLMFRTQGPGLLPQGTYLVQNVRIGTFALFVVPLGPPHSVSVYQAVFN